MGDTAELRKARGAFFTPSEITTFLAKWAIRSKEDSVLEPSCGDARFLASAVARLRQLGSASIKPTQLQGFDIHAESVENAENMLADLKVKAQLEVCDFFDVGPLFVASNKFDAIIGNPPYVRYQDFSGTARAKAQQAALAAGVRLTGLASSWAAFVVHATSFLKTDGRLALVLPAELLSVNYAAPVRRFLMDRFAEVRLVLFEGRIFPGVSEEVVLLLAEGIGPTDHFDVYQAKSFAELETLAPKVWFPATTDEKWLPALLSTKAGEIYRDLLTGPSFGVLSDWGRTDLGMVTGNNDYFTLTREKVAALGLNGRDLIPICPPSSRHLRGLTFTEKTWEEMAATGSRVYLFDPDPKKPSRAAKRYIEAGEQSDVHTAYKCRMRSPWWIVPKVDVPDLYLTYMNHDTPRLVANRVRARYLNSIHGVTLHKNLKALGADLLPLAMLNSLTVLGAELVGRSYGGGILKLEPKEADKLPLPSVETVRNAASELRSLRPQLAKHLRNKELEQVIHAVDRVLLLKHLRLKHKDVEQLRQAREQMFSRRSARAKDA